MRVRALPVLFIIGILMVVWELCGHPGPVLDLVRRLDPLAFRLGGERADS